VEYDDAARPHELGKSPQHDRRLLQIEQHEPPDQRIERTACAELFETRDFETHVVEPRGLRALACERNRFRRLVDAEHRSARADERSGKQADIAGAAADVEHVHTWREARARENGFCQLADEARLEHQPPVLFAAMSENIGLPRIVFHRRLRRMRRRDGCSPLT